MILAGGHRHYVFTVDHNDKAGFFPIQEFFHHDAVACIAEGVACQHVLHGVFRFLQRHGNNHAFTGRQAVGLDDDRCTFTANIGQRRFDFGKVLVLGAWNIMARQELFGEGFRAF
ncbi:hypothetical protein D3C80_886810 [compost metagenome]